MKTVKEMSEITGVSIRTLRYYDEIGLLEPTHLTDAGYRLYDNKALARLQEILFFKELEIPLVDIKKIMDDPNYDKKQVLLAQKSLLQQKRNRLNGIIELITDVMKGINTMNFEAFNDEDTKKILDHMLDVMTQEDKESLAEHYGSIEAFRKFAGNHLKDEKVQAQITKWYGDKNKSIEASLQSTGDKGELEQLQNENAGIYKQFITAKETDNADMAKEAVQRLAECYKKMFKLDNSKNILIDLANEYLSNSQLADANDSQFGKGCSEFAANAILKYYGV